MFCPLLHKYLRIQLASSTVSSCNPRLLLSNDSSMTRLEEASLAAVRNATLQKAVAPKQAYTEPWSIYDNPILYEAAFARDFSSEVGHQLMRFACAF